ncbi:MAG TPA: hypothetical protein VKY92_03995 [Verrucomicrobiae bacterium]|nr:hypothetical protein [Verrucomicrobiae bacterium]
MKPKPKQSPEKEVSAELFDQFLASYRKRVAKVAKALDAVEAARANDDHSETRRLLLEVSESLSVGFGTGLQLLRLLSVLEAAEIDRRSSRKASLN